MKWGKKTSSASAPSFGSGVFPGSWFSKLKQIGDGAVSSTLDTTKQPRGKLDSRQARFYRLDDDPFWTLSFRKDRGEGRTRSENNTIINPLSDNSDVESKQGPCSYNRGAQPRRAERRGFGTLVPQEGRRSHRNKGRRKLNKETQISNSFAVVKTSFNPQQDFRDSMLEMIRENGIRRRQDLQQLLACYLTVNSDTHHHLIINVFQHLCFESIHSQPKFE